MKTCKDWLHELNSNFLVAFDPIFKTFVLGAVQNLKSGPKMLRTTPFSRELMALIPLVSSFAMIPLSQRDLPGVSSYRPMITLLSVDLDTKWNQTSLKLTFSLLGDLSLKANQPPLASTWVLQSLSHLSHAH